jgi:hypothetical protein
VHGRHAAGIETWCSRLDQHVIHVAVAPVFSGLEGLDNRVSREVVVLGRVLVLGFIAATYVPAREAFPEMYPLVAGSQTLLAAVVGGDHTLPYLIGVCTAAARTCELAS